ncbi:MAG: urease subunit beta [Spirochaetaceae bacterium]|nr:urease subunit beta [Spirochaetaceae bacterium]
MKYRETNPAAGPGRAVAAAESEHGAGGGNGWAPGQVWTARNSWRSLAEREAVQLPVANTGDRPIQVGSHFHFFEVNRALVFDRARAYGMKLAIAAGTAVRFEPGQRHLVRLVRLGGERVCHGLNGLVGGALDDPAVRRAATARMREGGFGNG